MDEAARALQASGYTFDVAYTSMLKRAVETTWLLLKELNLPNLSPSSSPSSSPNPSPEAEPSPSPSTLTAGQGVVPQNHSQPPFPLTTDPNPTPDQELNLIHVPVIKDHKLNDRSYGALTGHSVAEFQEAYGAETVQSWRRSQSARPPAFQPDHPYDPASTGRYGLALVLALTPTITLPNPEPEPEPGPTSHQGTRGGRTETATGRP